MTASENASRHDEPASNNTIGSEESVALLHAIFPDYPDLDGLMPRSQVGAL
jgi:hypothetical protein